MEEGAKLKIYDPQVKFEQIQMDLSLNKFEWDAPANTLKAKYVLPHPTLTLQVYNNSEAFIVERILQLTFALTAGRTRQLLSKSQLPTPQLRQQRVHTLLLC